MRTCVGCRQEAAKAAMIRLVRRAGGGAAIDGDRPGQGRGAYLHRSPDCAAIARKKGTLERALRTAIQPELWSELIA
ncbi:MAG: YlxR family protein [Candidatus Dormibacterales bacterium]